MSKLFYIYDTQQVGAGKPTHTRFFCITHAETNVLQGNMLSDSNFKITGFLVGGPPAWLREIAKSTVGICIGQKIMLEQPIWTPPGAELTPDQLREFVRKGRAPSGCRDGNAGDVPDDWLFLAWHVTPPWLVDYRQCVSVAWDDFVQRDKADALRIVLECQEVA